MIQYKEYKKIIVWFPLLLSFFYKGFSQDEPLCLYPQFSVNQNANPIIPRWTPFTKCSNNTTIWDPSVIWDDQGQKYRLYFTRYNSCTKHMHIYTTESYDGYNWDSELRDIHDPTREPSWGQGVMDNFETTCALQINDSTIYLYFIGYTIKNRVERVGLLISSDFGQTYNPYSNNPVIVPTETWEAVNANGIKEPTVIFDRTDSLFKIWYNVTDYNKITRMGYAWSKDGINWTKYPGNPIFLPLKNKIGEEWAWEVNHVNVVQDPLNGYHLFYLNHMAIFQAYSTDGINWTREPGHYPQIMYSFDSAYQECQTCPWVFVNLTAYGSPSVIFKDDSTVDMFYMRTIPGAYSYGKNPPNVNGTGGMMLGFAKGSCYTTSIKNQNNFSSLSIFPNPASDYIEINVGARHAVPVQNEIKIYNALGECVLSVGAHCNVSLQRVDVSGLPGGIYLLIIQLNDNFSARKFIVQH